MNHLLANAIALVVGVVVALALAGLGAMRLAKIGLALKARGEGYKTLPLTRYIDIARVKTDGAARRIAAAPALVYRARAALADLGNSRAKAVAIVTSPSAIWRLGELIVTGR